MKRITLQEQKEIYERVVKLLVKERDYWEMRTKHPLSGGWRYPELWEIRKYFPEFWENLG
jgi:mRNA-degrading endonuclease YafQ of YafQ-DinJ toxin-antitoxin module